MLYSVCINCRSAHESLISLNRKIKHVVSIEFQNTQCVAVQYLIENKDGGVTTHFVSRGRRLATKGQTRGALIAVAKHW